MKEPGIIRTIIAWVKHCICEPVNQAWMWVRGWAIVLKPCRFPILMVLAGAVFLLFVPQGTDLLRGLAERVNMNNEKDCLIVFFIASGFFLSFNAWYWSRVMLFLKFPGVPDIKPGEEQTLHAFRTQAPRYIGFIAALVIAAAFFKASFGYNDSDGTARDTLRLYAAISLVAAVGFFIFVSKRREWTLYVHDKLESVSLLQNSFAAPVVGILKVTPSSELVYGTMRVRDLRRGTKITAIVTLFVAIFLFLLFVFLLQQTAPCIGAASILLFAAAGWIAFGSLIDIFGMSRRFPAISVLVALAILFSHWNDNHAVRTIDRSPVISRGTVNDALQAWHQHQAVRTTLTGSYPLFIVAAEGGGIRAAYWTASVLSRITDSNPCFPDQLFALSGVSGGSLGSAVFVAQLADAAVTDDGFYCDKQGNRAPGAQPLSAPAKTILSQDFLAPVMGAMLYPDLVQRILPFPIKRFDRARALEKAWEKSWNDFSTGNTGSHRFSERFDGLWKVQDSRWMPALFLNSTWVETGKRLIVSNVRLTPDDFMDAEDAVAFYGVDALRLSTAVHLSARFTYVSPAGTLKKGGIVYGHAVDGGYFENSGETTVMEVLKAIDQLKDNDPKKWKNIYPVVVHISNEPVNPRYKTITLDSVKKDKAHAPLGCLNEVLSPPLTMLNTRDARGAYAREAVKWYVEERNFLHFGLCKDRMDIPLGWALSGAVQEDMDKQLNEKRKDCAVFDNPEKLNAIREILKARYTRTGKAAP